MNKLHDLQIFIDFEDYEEPCYRVHLMGDSIYGVLDEFYFSSEMCEDIEEARETAQEWQEIIVNDFNIKLNIVEVD